MDATRVANKRYRRTLVTSWQAMVAAVSLTVAAQDIAQRRATYGNERADAWAGMIGIKIIPPNQRRERTCPHDDLGSVWVASRRGARALVSDHEPIPRLGHGHGLMEAARPEVAALLPSMSRISKADIGKRFRCSAADSRSIGD